MAQQMTFAQIGTLYNSISNELEGGVTPANQNILLQQVSTVQHQVQGLINSGALNNLSGPDGNVSIVHAQNIADQMNFLSQQISSYGSSAFNPKFINDVTRDVQDIVAGDPALSALAHQGGHSGFQQVSYLLTPPTPFADSGQQTATLNQFISDSNSLASRAEALAGSDPHSAAVHQLVSDVQTFSANANAYSVAQGGLFSARFNNEFTTNGVQGTASKELVAGLQSGNASLVDGAATVLVANASDVQGNMLSQGNSFTPAQNGGLPTSNGSIAVVPTVHDAGAAFNDAMTKLIGGVYSGNQTSIVNDLNAAQHDLQAAVSGQNLTGMSLQDVNKVIGLLGHESSLVAGINTATPTQATAINGQINQLQSQILNTVNHDATLAKLAIGADGVAGFASLPQGAHVQDFNIAGNGPPTAVPPTSVAQPPMDAHHQALDALAHQIHHIWG